MYMDQYCIAQQQSILSRCVIRRCQTIKIESVVLCRLCKISIPTAVQTRFSIFIFYIIFIEFYWCHRTKENYKWWTFNLAQLLDYLNFKSFIQTWVYRRIRLFEWNEIILWNWFKKKKKNYIENIKFSLIVSHNEFLTANMSSHRA